MKKSQMEKKRDIKMTSNWKAPGPDKIQGYFIKYIKIIEEDIIKLFKKWYNEENIPDEYCETNTILIYKTGDKKDPANYRPISCANILHKIYTSVLLKKIKSQLWLNNIELDKTQFGSKNNVLASK